MHDTIFGTLMTDEPRKAVPSAVARSRAKVRRRSNPLSTKPGHLLLSVKPNLTIARDSS
jgi:hypothetical protein